MLLNEIVKEVGMTKRAIKYYEEKGERKDVRTIETTGI